MYDVIVIGAGPGGNMAALKLSRMGYRVAVLDWRENIGDKLCTGIIGKECADRFPPDPAHVHHAARSATLVSPGGKRFSVKKEEPQAFIVDRVAYVNSVAERAMEAGADYILERRVGEIRVDDNGVSVVAGGNGRQVRCEAEALIIASGFGSLLVRLAGLSEWKPQEYMVGCQAEVTASELEETEVYLGDRVVPVSFAWLVPLSDSKALVGMAPRRRPDGRMEGFLSSLQKSGRVVEVTKKPQMWGIPIRPLPKTYADRILIAGDAAGLVKPTSGGGIYYAFLSGEMAAEAINEAFGKGDFSSSQLRSYERNWKGAFGKELRIGYYARMLYESLNDEQIESLLDEFLRDEVVNEVINAHDFSFDWHGRVIMSVLRHANIRQVVRSFGPAAATFVSRLVRDRA